MNSIMDVVKGCLFRQWAMKSPRTPHMWQWHWDWVIDTSGKEQTFYTFRVEIGFCAKGVSLLGGLGACPSPPGNFSNLVSLKWHFLHFGIIFLVLYKVIVLITDIFELFFAVVNPSFQNQKGRFLLLLLNGHFERSWITVNLLSTRHKCIQWGATKNGSQKYF